MTFEMWSTGHYIFILSPFLFTILFYYLMKGKTYEQKKKFGIWLSVIMIIILILRNVEIMIEKDFAFDYEYIPLQICHFANFVLLYAFIKDNKTMFALALLFNFPAAMMSIVFANSLANYSTILTFRGIAYIFGHILIVATTLWSFIEGYIKLNVDALKKTVLTVYILYIISVLINNIIGSLSGKYANYFYALKPENGTPLETFYNIGMNYEIGKFMINPIYLLLTGILGFIVVTLMFVLFRLIELAFNHITKTIQVN